MKLKPVFRCRACGHIWTHHECTRSLDGKVMHFGVNDEMFGRVVLPLIEAECNLAPLCEWKFCIKCMMGEGEIRGIGEIIGYVEEEEDE